MKARIKTLWDRIFFTPRPMPPGNYQTISEIDGKPYRLHLRIEPGGNGILILNASTILHLNPTATEIAYHLINKTPVGEAASELMKRYQVDYTNAVKDIEEFNIRLTSLIQTPDLDPETFLDMEGTERHKEGMSAPLRLDCALTYQLSDGLTDRNAPVDRVKRSLDSDEWKVILKKAWNAGIPHIVFTGGEPTLRPDIAELITFCEGQGQVTGLITDGLRLAEKDYLHTLLQSGLDHLMIVLDPENAQSWESIKDSIAEDIFITVHLTIKNNLKSIQKTIEKLHKVGVKAISLSASSREDRNLVYAARETAQKLGFSIVTDLPVPYSSINPLSLEMEEYEAHRNGAGVSWLYVEPDGDVLPGQGRNELLGNLLTDSWVRIWTKTK